MLPDVSRSEHRRKPYCSQIHLYNPDHFLWYKSSCSWIIFLNPHDLDIETLRIDNPIQSVFGIWVGDSLPPTPLIRYLELPFSPFPLWINFCFTVKVAYPVTHIVVDAEEIIEVFSCFLEPQSLHLVIQLATIDLKDVIYSCQSYIWIVSQISRI